ncbi:MAG: hypothetical protein JSR45_08895 [Proteobacteria bacterium]|nr:hypothetical protein [Pseudomonadota bacterium]
MTRLKTICAGMLAGCLCLGSAGASVAQTPPPADAAGRDGQHDFDFHLGEWKSHIRMLRRSPTGGATWVEMDGRLVARKVWDGRAQLEELVADGAGRHIEDLLLFLYNPQTRQWSLNPAASGEGVMGPTLIGEFRDGRGEFYDQEPAVHGRTVWVRQVWSDITPTTHHFEQAFSSDGGKTWETNFMATLTRQ